MKRLFLFGVIVTLVYLIGVVAISASNWSEFSKLNPNEWGDFLAGAFGPLAIFWLVLGFFQQGQELRHSVQALEKQSEELRAAALHQEKLAEAALEQIKLEKLHFETEVERSKRGEAGHILVSTRDEVSLDANKRTYSRTKIFDLVNVGGPVAHAVIILESGDGTKKLQRSSFWDRGVSNQVILQLDSPEAVRSNSFLITEFDGELRIGFVDRVNGYVDNKYRVRTTLESGDVEKFELI